MIHFPHVYNSWVGPDWSLELNLGIPWGVWGWRQGLNYSNHYQLPPRLHISRRLEEDAGRTLQDRYAPTKCRCSKRCLKLHITHSTLLENSVSLTLCSASQIIFETSILVGKVEEKEGFFFFFLHEKPLKKKKEKRRERNKNFAELKTKCLRRELAKVMFAEAGMKLS